MRRMRAGGRSGEKVHEGEVEPELEGRVHRRALVGWRMPCDALGTRTEAGGQERETEAGEHASSWREKTVSHGGAVWKLTGKTECFISLRSFETNS